MSILHVTPVYPPYKGGMGKVAFDYVNSLKARGECVLVLTPDYNDLDRSSVTDDRDVIWQKGFTYGKAAFLPQLLWKVRDCDVIHLHYPFYGTAIFTAIGAAIWRKKLILTYHMKTKGTGWLGLVFSLHRAIIEPIILGLSDTVLVSSIDYANSIGLRHHNLVDLPFGVDTNRFKPGSSSVRSKLGIDEDSMVGIFVGGLDDAHYFKGVDVLMAAAAKLGRDGQWDILIVGGGNRMKELEALAKELGVSNRIHFAGRVSDEDLPQYYRAADIHILPSIDRSEAFGLVTLEAAASGLPSIVSDLPGVRTLVKYQETGLFVIPGDSIALSNAILWFIDRQDAMRDFGRNARQRVEAEYSQEECINKLQQAYKGGKVE